jgi:hypothetical protein
LSPACWVQFGGDWQIPSPIKVIISGNKVSGGGDGWVMVCKPILVFRLDFHQAEQYNKYRSLGSLFDVWTLPPLFPLLHCKFKLMTFYDNFSFIHEFKFKC